MTNPVILLGTQSNGETLPVQVDATGRLVAEGLQGDKGDKGDKGDPGENGVGELPPNPEEGQVLGWQDGQLAWITASSGSFFFYLDVLVAAGGGNYLEGERDSSAGGGAGGFFHTRLGYQNPGGVPTPGAFKVDIDPLSQVDFTASAGGPGRESSFIGGGINIVLAPGGDGGNRQHGGSGGGGAPPDSGSMQVYLGGQGYEGQGSDGADSRAGQYTSCVEEKYTCNDYCRMRGGGGGGGAGGMGQGRAGGPGLASDITGEQLTYAVGGNGSSICSTEPKPPADGQGFWGCGASRESPQGQGVIILRYPSFFELSFFSGSFQRSDTSFANDTITTLSLGQGELKFSVKPEVVMGTVIDYLRRLRDCSRYANRVWT